MNILVLGNGFDIAHHLPTKYSDFLDFVKAFLFPDNSYYALSISKIKTTNSQLFWEMDSLIQDNKLIDIFLAIYVKRQKEGKEGWIDFEKEISDFVKALDDAKQYLAERVVDPDDSAQLSITIYNRVKPIIVKKK